ncbi:polymorphic outer membrane protein, putative [Trichomonas vaginalis G3]|uniref:Polymorphic outer membrane protein, putative n=1 Tax=Trichomonas vaginalis (strain ATCC PRA-98 / G3) TaxID=412133 RepID=A2F1L4_TRIV3|nr:bifunctional inhibitor/lipid-transfer protein/seed storage 2s albumin superfamily protein family [Trichomonas vaginalis G3]EAY01232.1 polymorphic outer membrane protein, putative [Trichomonas vaginalis G3]KAI5532488.1 bifunctional inhibitor/lipid-transfer protein/seed storage 2s albumin superfamily protein family [Trichomonas vaginalis G3]|eukprot:XP_001330148.1 polymorphic outer membrane protein [Trichomonas vaginalis G3]
MLLLFLPQFINSLFDLSNILEGVGVPSFLDNNNSSQNLTDIESRINAGFTIDSKNETVNTLRINREFYLCSVEIKNSTFKNNYAFGAVTGGPCGGAVYGYRSSFHIIGSNFSNNQAIDGGAISFTECNALLQLLQENNNQARNKFSSNIAFCSGGAIFFEGQAKNHFDNNLQIWDSNFSNNTAYQTGGAIHATIESQVSIINSKFDQNRAGDNGGAIYTINSDLYLFDSCIVANRAGKNEYNSTDQYSSHSGEQNKTDKLYHMEEQLTRKFLCRGCGGVAFIVIDLHYNLLQLSQDKNYSKSFYSQQCTYYQNHMYRGILQQSYNYNLSKLTNITGYDIMVQNEYNKTIKFQTYSDYFKGNFQSSTIRIGDVELYYYSHQHSPIANCSTNEALSTQTTNISQANSTNKSRDVTGKVATPTEYTYVATPTEYTYVATPITRLPKATTQSPKTYPTTTHYTTISRPPSAFPRTPVSTPFSTMFTTPHSTRHSTPFSTAHKTPFITVFSTPHSTPHSTAHSTASFTPLSTPYIPPIDISKPTDVTGESSGYTKSLTEVQYQYHTDYLTNISTDVGNKINNTETNITTIAYANTSVLTWVITSGVETTSTVTWTYIESNTTTLTVSTTLVEKNTSIKASEGNEEDNTSTLSLVETKTIVTTYTMTLVMTETNIIIPLDDSTVGSNVKSGTIILIAVLCLVAVFCLAIIGLFLYRKSHNKSSESESSINDDSDLFNDETRQQQTIVTFNADDDNTMLSTFNMGTDNIEDNEESLNDDDEMFLNAEF